MKTSVGFVILDSEVRLAMELVAGLAGVPCILFVVVTGITDAVADIL